MSVPFQAQPFGPIPEIFEESLAPGIFGPAESNGCPFFSSAEFSPLVNSYGKSNPDVIITGQQPGFMGGPLYTLYKIATTISLAKLRSEKGHPTVPVFWAGDDDDDLVEAMTPTAWDPLLGKFFSGQLPSKFYGNRILGELDAAIISNQAQLWFESLAKSMTFSNSAADFAHLYSLALEENWTWSKLFCAGVELVFPKSGLITVRGNDPRLHQVALPFYTQVLPKLPVLQRLATEDPGSAINERSINNPLFQIDGGRRQRLKTNPQVWDASLRPGILLRSMLQDWLFNPLAVVVGPGEKAYLKQLEPLYLEMGIPRSVLVPRLFAWLVAEGVSPENLRKVSDISIVREKHHSWTESLKVHLADKLTEIFHNEAGLPMDQAKNQAQKKSLRMTRNLPDYFREMEQIIQGSSLSEMPPWVLPGGQRQERSLASFNAFAMWGTPLIDIILKTAQAHLKLGLEGRWQEMIITVPTAASAFGKDCNDV